MIQVVCDWCDREIKRPFYPFELKFKKHFCNRQCRDDFRRETGFFKRMSEAGKAGRSRVMPQSNKDKPRRRIQAKGETSDREV